MNGEIFKAAVAFFLLTVADFLNNKGVKADFVNALIQAVGFVDLLHLAMQTFHLGVIQVRTKDFIIELLWNVKDITTD